MRKGLELLVASSGLFLSAAKSNADIIGNWIYNPTTQHEYALTSEDTWMENRDFAKSVGGYLVSINDVEEQNWLVNNFNPSSPTVCIGLTDELEDGLFKWDSGEPLTYQNWRDGEPNNFGGDEDYTVMHTTFGTSLYPHNFPGQWQDYGGFHPPLPGIVERVPTPSSLFLLTGAGLGLSIRRNRN